MQTLVDILLQSAQGAPEKQAVVDPGGTWTFREVYGAALSVAAQVAAATDAPRVGLLLPSGRGFAAGFFGALLAGRTPVPLNLALSPAELAFCMSDAGLDCLLTVTPLADQAAALGGRVVLVDGPGPPPADAPSSPEWTPDDAAVILYTSGTTARPKGVVLTHANLLANAGAGIEALALRPDHVVLGLLPLFHSFGLTCSLVIPVVLGATSILVPRFQPTTVVDLLRAHRPSAIFAIAGMYGALLRTGALAAIDVSSLEFCVAGGEALPAQVREAFEAQTGTPLLEGYGLTETSPVVSVNRPDALRPGTAGHPLPGVRLRIVDADGRDVPPGAEGEVWVAGPGVMRGYHDRPDETAAVLTDDGWLRTGDLGRLDDTGALAITGRLKDLIICGGENIAPREIEDVLDQHPGVAEVAVIGVPDGVRGEAPKAFVVAREASDLSAADLGAFCRERLAGFKVPRQFAFLPELPKGPTGKVHRRALREQDRDA